MFQPSFLSCFSNSINYIFNWLLFITRSSGVFVTPHSNITSIAIESANGELIPFSHISPHHSRHFTLQSGNSTARDQTVTLMVVSAVRLAFSKFLRQCFLLIHAFAQPWLRIEYYLHINLHTWTKNLEFLKLTLQKYWEKMGNEYLNCHLPDNYCERWNSRGSLAVIIQYPFVS